MQKHSHYRGPRRRRERDRTQENISLVREVKNFPNMEKEIATQVQEAQRVPGRINPRTHMLRHTVIKLNTKKNY